MVAVKGKGWKLAPSLLALVKQLDDTYPGRDRTSDGSIGDQAHASRESDHNPHDGFVHAVDLDEDIAPGLDLKQFALALERSRDSRLRYAIYEGRILKAYASNGLQAWSWHRYTGANSHSHHLHVSINRTAKARDDLRPWPLQEDDMTPAQEAALNKIAADVASVRAETDKFWTGETVTRIAEAVVKLLPAANGGGGLTADQVADELAERLKS